MYIFLINTTPINWYLSAGEVVVGSYSECIEPLRRSSVYKYLFVRIIGFQQPHLFWINTLILTRIYSFKNVNIGLSYSLLRNQRYNTKMYVIFEFSDHSALKNLHFKGKFNPMKNLTEKVKIFYDWFLQQEPTSKQKNSKFKKHYHPFKKPNLNLNLGILLIFNFLANITFLTWVKISCPQQRDWTQCSENLFLMS